MVQTMKNLVYRVGHRGAFLLFLALLDAIYGWSMFTIANASPQYRQLVLWFPWDLWGWTWIVVGVILLVGTFTRDDRWYYGIAATLKGVWAAAWLSAWMFEHAYLGWVSTVIWAAFAMLVVVVSSWPEARRFRPDKHPERVEDVLP